MPRDVSGNYTLPAGNPVVDGTVIETTWANPTMADIAAQLNNVLTRDGVLGPTTQFISIDGTVAAPGLSFASDIDTGLYRPAVNTIAIAAGGVEAIVFNNAGISVSLPIELPGGFVGQILADSGTALLPGYSFLSDPNTGIYNSGADQLSWATAGAQRGVITAAGEWVMSKPTGGNTLSIVGSATIALYDDAASNYGRLWHNGGLKLEALGANDMLFATGGLVRAAIPTTGGLSVVAPSSGNALTTDGDIVVTGGSNVRSIGFNFFSAQGPRFVVDGTFDGNRLVLQRQSAATVMAWSSAGSITIYTPGSGITLLSSAIDNTGINFNPASGSSFEASSSGVSVGSGGTITFSAADGAWKFAAIKGLVQSAAGNSVGDVAFGTRRQTSDSTLTEAMRIALGGNITINEPSSGIALSVGGVNAGTHLSVGHARDGNALFGNSTSLYNAADRYCLEVNGDAESLLGLKIAGSGAAYFFASAGVLSLMNTQAGNLSLGTNGTEKIFITSDGRLYGNSLHNNAGSLTGTVNQYIASGTYVPTIALIANVDSAGTNGLLWIRTGNVVTVSGAIQIDATSNAGVLTQIGIPLPIASNLGMPGAAAGVGYVGGATIGSSARNGAVIEDTVNDRALYTYTETSVATSQHYIHFQYLIS